MRRASAVLAKSPVAGLLLAAVLIVVLQMPGRPAMAAAPGTDVGTARYEIRFLERMIDHHTMAIELATACVANAVHDELRSLCQDIITAQASEIAEMQSCLLDCHGMAYQPQLKRGDMRQVEQLAALGGADFEVAFMTMMVRHHLQAIREASKCVERTDHDDLRALCEEIVTAQAAEIEQVRAWLCAWYGLCRRERDA